MTSNQRWCNYRQWCRISWQTHSLFLHSNPIFEDSSMFITSFRHPKQELMIQIKKFLHDENISLHSEMYENLKTQPAIWMVSNLDILQTVYERNPSVTERDPRTVCQIWRQGKEQSVWEGLGHGVSKSLCASAHEIHAFLFPNWQDRDHNAHRTFLWVTRWWETFTLQFFIVSKFCSGGDSAYLPSLPVPQHLGAPLSTSALAQRMPVGLLSSS